jgi:outer membrane protein
VKLRLSCSAALTLALLLAPVALAQTAPVSPVPATPVPATPVPATPVPVVTPAPLLPAPTAPSPASTAPAAATRLTLAQALAGLQQAPGWRSAALQYRSASQSLDAARARAGLSLSAGASVSAVKAPIDGDWSSSTTLNVQAGINVLPWSSAQAGVVQAEHVLYRAGLDQKDSQNSLTLTVVQGYLAARQASAARTAAAVQQDLAARQLEVARAQQASGVLTQENLFSAQASQEQAAAALAAASSDQDSALRQLYNTLGVSLPAGQPELSSRPVVPTAPAPLDALLARAATGRSEVLKALSSSRDAQLGVNAARLDRSLPDVSLSVQYGELGSGTGAAGGSVNGGLNFKTGQLTAGASLPLKQSAAATGSGSTTSLALGLSGSYAILNPAADVAVQSAQTSLASAQLALASARESVDLDVRQKYAAFQNALLGLNAPRTSLARALIALTSAQSRQQAGLATALDVQQAQLALVQAQNALDAAVNSAYLASLNLSVASAEFSPALITLPDALQARPDLTSTAPTGDQP